MKLTKVCLAALIFVLFLSGSLPLAASAQDNAHDFAPVNESITQQILPATTQQESIWSGTITVIKEERFTRNETWTEGSDTYVSQYLHTSRWYEQFTILGPAGDDPDHVLVQVTGQYESSTSNHDRLDWYPFSNPKHPCYGPGSKVSTRNQSAFASMGGVYPFKIGLTGIDEKQIWLSSVGDVPGTTLQENRESKQVDTTPCGVYVFPDSSSTDKPWTMGDSAQTRERYPMPDPERFSATEVTDEEHMDGKIHKTYHSEVIASITRKPLRIADAQLQQRLYPSGAWGSSSNGVVDGNLARIHITLEEYRQATSAVTVEVTDEESGRLLLHARDVSVSPDIPKTIVQEFSTTNLAFKSDKSPRTDVRFKVRLLEGNTEVDSRIISVPIMPKPVLLVHGLWSDAGAWESYPAFLGSVHPNWKGIAVTGMNTGSLTPSGLITETNTIAQNAAVLGRQIEEVRREYNAWQVDVVAHSMGGLITRKYIQTMPMSTGNRPTIANLMMLGTPNRGSPCADIVTGVQALALKKFIAAPVELMPSTVATFNIRNSQSRGVIHSIVAGEVMPFTCYEPAAGDGVVTVPSAQHTFTDKDKRSILHTSMGGDRALFDSFVKPRLVQGRDVVPVVSAVHENGAGVEGAMSAEELLFSPGAESATNTPSIIYAHAPVIAAGKTETFTVTIPSASAFGLVVAANHSFSITLEAPDDTRVWTERAGSPGTYQGMRWTRVVSPAAGEWQITLENVMSEASPALVGIWVEGGAIALSPASNVPATSASEDTVAKSVPVTLMAIQNGAPLTGQSIPALLAGAAEEQTIQLLDDGAHGDGAPNDGVYGGTFVNLSDGVYWWGASLESGGVTYQTSGSFVLGNEPMPEIDYRYPQVFVPFASR